MILPQLDDPPRYQGLYIFDFGDSCAVGYTAEEVATLLESDRHRDGKVYRIHRAWPDGRMELRGVSADRFQLESGMFFYRERAEAAREDFDELAAAAEASPPPCRARLHLVERNPACPPGERDIAPLNHVTALIFPAEYEDDIGGWLTQCGFAGGDIVEGGISHVTNYLNENARIIERRQMWSANRQAARSTRELLASVGRAVQR